MLPDGWGVAHGSRNRYAPASVCVCVFRLDGLAASQRQHQMEHGAALHLVVGSGLIVIPAQGGDLSLSRNAQQQTETNRRSHAHLFAGEDQPLLLRRNALLLLDALLDAVHLVGGLDVDLDLLAGEGLHKGGTKLVTCIHRNEFERIALVTFTLISMLSVWLLDRGVVQFESNCGGLESGEFIVQMQVLGPTF